MEYLDKNGKPLKKGDVVEWGAGHKGTVVELSSFGIRVHGYGIRGLEEWTGGSSQVRKVSNSAPRSSNPVVQNALAAKACNTSQLELSLRYAGRLQSELRDVARSGNGRVSSSNTVEFPNEDAAEDAMEYLVRYAHVPKDEVWINSRVRNSGQGVCSTNKRKKWASF